MRPYTTPLILSACVLGGLLLALVTEGALDVVALALVATPLVTIASKVWRRAAS